MLGDNLSSSGPPQKSLNKVQPDRERGGGGGEGVIFEIHVKVKLYREHCCKGVV